MRPIVTPAEMAAFDRAAIDAGTPESELIDRAGRVLARFAEQMLGGTYGRRVVVLAGPGNNGNDGRVAAAVLAGRGVRVRVIDVPFAADRTTVGRAIARADLVVDAMYGTGLRSALVDDAAWVAEQLATVGARVVAVDVPSGVQGATGVVDGVAVRAERTLCFQALKPGLLFEPGRSHAGTVGVAELAIPVASRAAAVDRSDLVGAVPRRPAAAHKWSRAVLVVGGSGGMSGAPLLAARAAQRSGAGMVVAALPGVAAERASGSEIVTRRTLADPDGSFAAEAAPDLLEQSARFGAVVLGPGIGTTIGADAVVGALTAAVPVPLVVDADALTLLARDPSALRVRRAAGLPRPVLTPHDGEFARLGGRPVGPDRIAAARELAATLDAVVLLKGPGTVVADPDGTVRVVLEGGSELATAGTGDVLAGAIGAALAAGEAPFAAAWRAAVAHGIAGGRSPHGAGTVASDVVAALPVAWSGATDAPPTVSTVPTRFGADRP